MTDHFVDQRVSELGERTRGIGPRPGFQARVLAALAARAQASVRAEVWRSARLFVPAAFVLALISLGVALRASGPSSADVAVAEQLWERDW